MLMKDIRIIPVDTWRLRSALHPKSGTWYCDSVCEKLCKSFDRFGQRAYADGSDQSQIWSQSLHFASMHSANSEFVLSSLTVFVEIKHYQGTCILKNFWDCIMPQWLRCLGREHIPLLTVHKSPHQKRTFYLNEYGPWWEGSSKGTSLSLQLNDLENIPQIPTSLPPCRINVCLCVCV